MKSKLAGTSGSTAFSSPNAGISTTPVRGAETCRESSSPGCNRTSPGRGLAASNLALISAPELGGGGGRFGGCRCLEVVV
jgi:hypothetical protein